MIAQMGETDTRFIVTVDTETFSVNGTPPPFESNIYAPLPEAELGVHKIMEICDRHGVKGTFFVDVYMHYHYGEKDVKELCQFIDQRGHDVQLHAHTAWLPNSKADDLCTFPLERQVEILAEGRELIHKWTGKAPVAFRAGSYAANLDTIRALERNGFVTDSSYFPFHRNCKLSKQLHNRYANKPFRIGGILEIPVTTYWLINTSFFRKISKLDVNSSSLAELMDIIPKLMESRVGPVVLFLHSFSFIRWKKDNSGVLPNYRALERFETIVDAICKRGYQTHFCTMAEISRSFAGENEHELDFIPTVKASGIIPRALQRILG